MASRLTLISCPYGEAGQHLGAEEGPKALLEAGIGKSLSALGYHVSTFLIPVPKEDAASWAHGLHNLPNLLKTLKSLKDITFQALQEGSLPCILGGDHSVSMGSISGIMEHCRKEHKTLVVLWFDAHADCNTPQTSLTGNIHGMPVAHLCGWGDPSLLRAIGEENFLSPDQIYYFGLRSIDSEEEKTLKEHPFHVYEMEKLKKEGLPSIMNKVIEDLKKQPNIHIHISFDIDVLDASIVPGTGTPVEDGLTLSEIRQAFMELHESRLVHSAEIMELNPKLDPSGQTTKDIAALVPVLFGQTI